LNINYLINKNLRVKIIIETDIYNNFNDIIIFALLFILNTGK